jgi:hypothetical protein
MNPLAVSSHRHQGGFPAFDGGPEDLELLSGLCRQLSECKRAFPLPATVRVTWAMTFGKFRGF